MSMSPYNPDITRALKWMHNNAPNLQSIIQQKANWYQRYNAGFWSNWEANVFNLKTANAFGLVVWCIILGLPLDIFVFDPVTNAFAFGKQRGNFLDSGGHVAPISFVGSPTIYANGVLVPSANWSLNSTTDQITFTSPPANLSPLTWKGVVLNAETGQQTTIQQARPFGVGNGSTTVFSLIPTDSANYNQTGNNFYGGGSSVVGLLSEIRFACQLRYIALVSNGRQQWINQMLRYIFNDDAAWNFAAGKYFYLTDGTQAVQLASATLQAQGWGGTVPLSLTARTNLISTNTGLAASASWVASSVTKAGATGPDNVANQAALLTPSSAAGTVTGPASTVALNTVYVGSYFLKPGTATQTKVAFGPAVATITWGSTPSVSVTGGAGQASIVAVPPQTGYPAGYYRLQFTFNSGTNNSAATVVTPDPTGANGTVTIALPQIEAGAVAGYPIKTSGSTASQTDYTLNTSTGAVVTGFVPSAVSTLLWSGSWNWATTNGYQVFGHGDGTTTAFTLSAAPGSIRPVNGTNYMEYRVGSAMNLSSQFLTILNNPSYGIMPTCAGIRYAVVQE